MCKEIILLNLSDHLIKTKKYETFEREQTRILDRYLHVNLETLDKDELISMMEKIIIGNETNFIFLTDAYKYSHYKFYTKGLTKLTTYLESRGGKFNETVMFGTQYILKKYLVGPVLAPWMIDDAETKLQGANGTFGPNGSFSKELWTRLYEKHGGRLPIRIKAVPEGTVITTKNVLMLVENTDDEFPWLTSFIESLLLQVWYGITVATLSREVKKIIIKYLKLTSSYTDEQLEAMAQFILNDFGVRASTSMESAGIGGGAHLVNHMGSDNIPGGDMLTKFYNTLVMWCKSVDATEHTICTMEGEEGELNVFKRVLETTPEGIVACVSDSFNIFRACAQYWGTDLKELVLSRKGVLVIRPDSGNPERTLKEVFKILFEKFGYTTNDKGFKVLPPQVRVIQGDSVNYESIISMYDMLLSEKIAAENLVLGMGGKLLQSGIDRDLLNFAIKACFGIINGKYVDIQKSPTEMDAYGNIKVSFKKSKKGEIKLIKDENGAYLTITREYPGFDTYQCLLVPVFENGELLVDEKFETIRERAKVF